MTSFPTIPELIKLYSKKFNVLNDLPELENNKKVISILSGGLDSTILLYLLFHKYTSQNIIALSFDYNQKHSKELSAARITCKKLNIPHKILDIKFFGDLIAPVSSLSSKSNLLIEELDKVEDNKQPNTYVPYRNMLFTTLAFSFAESNNASYVFLGAQAGDLYGYWDCSMKFIDAMNNVSILNKERSISLKAPFANFSKGEEISLGLDLKVPFKDTWSCYSGKEKACGVCPTCKERLKAFDENGFPDPIEYE